MLKNDILSLGDIHHQHLRGHFALVIGRKTYAITLCAGDSPVAEPACRVVDIRHDLSASAVCLAPAAIIQFALDAVQQAADCFVVLS